MSHASRTFRTPRLAVTLSALATAVVACSSDAIITPVARDPDVVTGPAVLPPRPDSTAQVGAIAGIKFMSTQLTVPLHARRALPVVPVNAQGQPSLALLAK